MGTYVLKKSQYNQYYWVLVPNNNQVICVSEQYTTKSGAMAGIEACRRLSPYAENYAIFTGRDNQYYWHLKGKNGEIVAQSEGYQTKQGATNGIASCMANGPSSPVRDETAQVA